MSRSKCDFNPYDCAFSYFCEIEDRGVMRRWIECSNIVSVRNRYGGFFELSYPVELMIDGKKIVRKSGLVCDHNPSDWWSQYRSLSC